MCANVAWHGVAAGACATLIGFVHWLFKYNFLDPMENQSCDTVFCALGKECVMKNKQPDCECIEKCHGPYSPVCGSDGVDLTTYKSECHLYKAGCEKENTTITLVAEMSCEKGSLLIWL